MSGKNKNNLLSSAINQVYLSEDATYQDRLAWALASTRVGVGGRYKYKQIQLKTTNDN